MGASPCHPPLLAVENQGGGLFCCTRQAQELRIYCALARLYSAVALLLPVFASRAPLAQSLERAPVSSLDAFRTF